MAARKDSDPVGTVRNKLLDTSAIMAALTGYAYVCGVSYYVGFFRFFNAGPYALGHSSETYLMVGFTIVFTLGIALYILVIFRSYIPYRTIAAQIVKRISRNPLGVTALKVGKVYAILLMLMLPVIGASAYGKRNAYYTFHNICVEGRFVISQSTGPVEKVMCMVSDSDKYFFVHEPGLKLPQPTLIPRSQVLSVTILGTKENTLSE